MFVLPLLSLLLATTGFAIPFHHGRNGGPISSAVLEGYLPPNQTTLVAPANATAKAVVVGVGNQNYTCTSGKFSSIGAVARMFDISNLAGGSDFATIQDCLHDSWVANPTTDPLDAGWVNSVQTDFGLQPVAIHTFVQFNGALTPQFDFSGDIDLAKKSGDIPSPDDPTQDVDWLQLTTVSGSFANTIFRVLTKGGVPPAQCTGAETTTVKYAAQYFFF